MHPLPVIVWVCLIILYGVSFNPANLALEREALYCKGACCLSLQGLHPRIIAEGFEAASHKAAAALEELKVTREMDRETLISVARTSLRTKVHKELADLLTEVRSEKTAH